MLKCAVDDLKRYFCRSSVERAIAHEVEVCRGFEAIGRKPGDAELVACYTRANAALKDSCSNIGQDPDVWRLQYPGLSYLRDRSTPGTPVNMVRFVLATAGVLALLPALVAMFQRYWHWLVR